MEKIELKPIKHDRKSKGQTLVELALSIPVVLLITLGSIQMFYELFQIQIMNRAVEAGALAITYGTALSAEADALKAVNNELKLIHLDGKVTPKVETKTQPATVEISAPLQLLLLKFDAGKILRAKGASFYIDRMTLDNSKTDFWFGGSRGFSKRPPGGEVK